MGNDGLYGTKKRLEKTFKKLKQSDIHKANKRLIEELGRLSNSFGIGIIKLDIPDSTKIIFPAKRKADLDWDTINKLCGENTNFKKFIERVSKDLKTDISQGMKSMMNYWSLKN